MNQLRRIRFWAPATIMVCLTSILIISGQNPPGTGRDGDPGVPMFLTSPVDSDIAARGLTEGHRTFDNTSRVPAPFQVDLGAAAYNPATPGTGFTPLQLPSNVSNSSEYEGETGAASYGGLIVGGSNHIFPGACGSNNCFPLAYASTNGTQWTKTVLPRVWNGVNLGIGFDPSIDVDKTGVFYYVYGVAPLSGNYPNGVVAVKSSDGQNWSQLPTITFNNNKFFDDKYWVAVDRSNSNFANRIYVVWDRNTATNQILYVSYSANGGQSWSSPIQVNDGRSKFERVIGAYPAVDQNTGRAYVSWHDYARNVIYVDKSTNGGVTWGSDVAAATTHTGFGMDIGCVGGRSQSPAHHLKVGSDGTLHLVYADKVAGRGFDILYTRSTTGGASWSTPVSLNDDIGSADQFHPTLSVDGIVVTVSWYDRRNDSANCQAQVYAGQSADGGMSWATNSAVYTVNSNFDGNPNGPGDYSSATPSSLGGVSFFSIHPSGQPFDVYASTIPNP